MHLMIIMIMMVTLALICQSVDGVVLTAFSNIVNLVFASLTFNTIQNMITRKV